MKRPGAQLWVDQGARVVQLARVISLITACRWLCLADEAALEAGNRPPESILLDVALPESASPNFAPEGQARRCIEWRLSC